MTTLQLSTPTSLIALCKTLAIFLIYQSFSEKVGNSVLPFPHLCPGKEGAGALGLHSLVQGTAICSWSLLFGGLCQRPPGIRLCLLMLTFSPQASEAHAAESSDFEEKPTAGGGQQGRDE